MSRRIDLDGGYFALSFPYDPRLVAAVKGLPGRRWDPGTKRWLVPRRHENRLVAFAAAWGFEMPTATGTGTAAAAPVPPRRGGSVLLADRWWEIRFPFDRALLAAVKALPERRFEPERKVWLVPADQEEAVRSFASAQGLEVARPASSPSRPPAPVADLEGRLVGLWPRLRPFQREAVARMTALRRVLLADEMGLGKTVEALAALEAAGAFPALVVCPASLKLNWEREAGAWLPARSIEVLFGREADPTGADLTIVNYALLSHLRDRLRGAGFRGLVADEAHYLKEPRSQRSRAIAAIGRDIDVRYLLSGTPIVNRPAELLSLLRLLDRLDDLGGWEYFTLRYCDRKPSPWHAGWDLSGAANLGELHRELVDACMIRRRKAEVLAELPPKAYAPVPVALAPEAERRYRELESEVRRWAESAPEPADGAEAERQGNELMGYLARLRRAVGEGKQEPATRWIEGFLESGEKLVVFAWHRDVVAALADHFSAPRIYGGLSAAARQEAVDRFQTEPEVRLLVANIQAAGVGLTLTAASNVAFVELPWTAADLEQASDRCHRIGQRDAVTAWLLMAPGTLDLEIWRILERKAKVAGESTDGVARRLPQAAEAILSSLGVRRRFQRR